jgi:hypothetical protein
MRISQVLRGNVHTERSTGTCDPTDRVACAPRELARSQRGHEDLLPHVTARDKHLLNMYVALAHHSFIDFL